MSLVRRSVLCALALITLVAASGVARADNYKALGIVYFSNVQAGTQEDGVVPYLAVGASPQLGAHIQTGSIRNLTGLIPVDATTLTFKGEVGPHPFLPGNPEVHVITTAHGNIYCTWTADFTLSFINAAGDAVFSGDGDFLVTGGTGRYANATGRFRTLFETGPVPFGADEALAVYSQKGKIKK